MLIGPMRLEKLRQVNWSLLITFAATVAASLRPGQRSEVAEKVQPPRTLFVPIPIGYLLGARARPTGAPAFGYSGSLGFVRYRPRSSTALLP